jgi:hypothetical protein
MKKFIIGLLTGVLLAVPSAAIAQDVFDETIKEVGRGSGGYVRRWDDPDFKVKCWESKDFNSGGLSCLPWDQVKERQ